MKMIWCGLKIEENYHVLVNQFHRNFRSKTLGCRKIKSVFRDVKWCLNASWGLKGLTLLFKVSYCILALQSSIPGNHEVLALCCASVVYDGPTSDNIGPTARARVVVSTAAIHASPGLVSRSRQFERNKNVSSPSTCKTQICVEPPWSRVSVVGQRPQGFQFRILCLEHSAIQLISPFSGVSPGPI